MMLKIRFHSTEYYLTDGNLNEGPIATADQYIHGLQSFAHLFPDGHVCRYGRVIGQRDEIEVLAEVEDLQQAEDALDNILDESVWSRPQ